MWHETRPKRERKSNLISLYNYKFKDWEKNATNIRIVQ